MILRIVIKIEGESISVNFFFKFFWSKKIWLSKEEKSKMETGRHRVFLMKGRSFLRKLLLLLGLFYLIAAVSSAVTVEKVYILKRIPPRKMPGMKPDLEPVVLQMPTENDLARFKTLIASKDTIQLMDVREGEWIMVENVSKDQQDTDDILASHGLEVAMPNAAEMDLVKHDIDSGLNALTHWEFQLGMGANFPISPEMAQAYDTGTMLDLYLGYRFDRGLSLLFGLGFDQFNPSSQSQTNGYSLSYADIGLYLKWRLITEGVRPYLFVGPSVGGGNYTNTTLNGSYTTTIQYTPGGADFVVKVGAGLEVPLVSMLNFYVQGQVMWDFASSNWTSFTNLDNRIDLVPVEAGLTVAR